MTGMGFCNLCETDVPTLELISHISMYHPDFYEPMETWPDGEIVVIDTSLEPEDFMDEAAERLLTLARPTWFSRLRARFIAFLKRH